MEIKKHLSLFAILSIACQSFVTGNNGSADGEKGAKSILDPAKPSRSIQSINSHSYNAAIGVRGIGTSGITIKYFNTSSTAIEGVIGFGPGAFSLTALWEKYHSAFDEPGLDWYYGVGGHIATQTDWVYNDGLRRYRRADGDFGIGIDGIFGIEYKINAIPIAVSVDVKPFLEITTNGDAYLATDPGLGVKFTF